MPRGPTSGARAASTGRGSRRSRSSAGSGSRTTSPSPATAARTSHETPSWRRPDTAGGSSGPPGRLWVPRGEASLTLTASPVRQNLPSCQQILYVLQQYFSLGGHGRRCGGGRALEPVDALDDDEERQRDHQELEDRLKKRAVAEHHGLSRGIGRNLHRE